MVPATRTRDGTNKKPEGKASGRLVFIIFGLFVLFERDSMGRLLLLHPSELIGAPGREIA